MLCASGTASLSAEEYRFQSPHNSDTGDVVELCAVTVAEGTSKDECMCKCCIVVGLEVTCSPQDPRFMAEVDGFFQDVKILSTSPPGGTDRKSVV